MAMRSCYIILSIVVIVVVVILGLLEVMSVKLL